MERITSKLTRVLAITLLSAATMMTAGALTLKASNRVKPGSEMLNPSLPICERAQEARARNSPAAPGLEEQCRAQLAARGAVIANEDPFSAELRNQQPEGPARRGFDIGIAAAEGQTAPDSGKQRMHDSLSPAEQEGFRIAVLFSLSRNKDVERNRNAELAARGLAIASEVPLVAEFRNQQPEGPARRGFDIGIAAAEGQTAPGPDKQRIRDSLSREEQEGFSIAVSYSLSLNRNQEWNKIEALAARGAAIANEDPLTAELRKQQPEGPARRGFDIGMAAAEGKTLPGPGKQGIPDSLSPEEQGGFRIAVSFSLARNRTAESNRKR